MKSLKKKLHVITFACVENQFRYLVVKLSVVYSEGKVSCQTEENYNSLT